MKKMIAVTGCFVIFCLVINGILIPSLPSVNAENTPQPHRQAILKKALKLYLNLKNFTF